MDEAEKVEIIKEINEIRKELGLQPYSKEYLESKDVSELRGLLREYIKLLEGKKRKPKMKFSRKLILTFPIILLISFFLIIHTLTKPKAVNPSELPPLQPLSEYSQNSSLGIYELLISLQSYFKDEKENYVLVLKNEANEYLVFREIRMDDEKVEWKVVSGNYPIPPNDIVYISVSKRCDGLAHMVKIETNAGDTEFELSDC